MAELGSFALLLALFLSGYAVAIDLLGSWRRDSGLIKSARNATVASLACLTIAMVALWALLINSDFSVIYVAEHTSAALPFPYKISALWAGSAGSLLLWLWLQVGFLVLAYCKSEYKHRVFSANARIIANLVSVFFLIILNKDKNPFELSAVAPADGSGLNPLLQHPAMVLHPPILFIGYAGFMITCAWAFSRLTTIREDKTSILLDQARRWTLFAWLFLTGGIVLGAWWAYEELGWGGYWAWDPVENSSLLPWLTATALLHCFRVYNSRSSIATWTILLGIITFSLCIFGRFLTKYGLIYSVHAFGNAGLGILHVVLLINIWAISGILALRKYIRGKNSLPKIKITGHRFVILNNWLLLLLVLVILIGTLFPFLSKVFIKIIESVSSQPGPQRAPITLAPEFFTKISAPGGLLLLLFIGLCPYLLRHGFNKSWRIILGIIAFTAALTAWLLTCSLETARPADFSEAIGWWGRWLLSGSPSVPCFILSAFVLLNILADFVGHKLKTSPEIKNNPSSRNLRWYGARIVHLGVAVMFIGIAGSGGYAVEKTVALRPGEKTNIAEYEMTYEDLNVEHGKNFIAVAAEISVCKKDKLIAQLKPAKAFYHASGKNVSEIDVRRTLTGDLYLALTEVDSNQKLINLNIMIKPLINWIWIGSLAMVLGALAVLVSSFKRKPKTATDNNKDTQ
ncbi:MAG: heme lyase CcmF/NrfE family subunit [Sedimentisphaerales bacterium]|nr:heme lyase CcmF/NrfE family subunit [Sedimentisphaerales bacterium]